MIRPPAFAKMWGARRGAPDRLGDTPRSADRSAVLALARTCATGYAGAERTTANTRAKTGVTHGEA